MLKPLPTFSTVASLTLYLGTCALVASAQTSLAPAQLYVNDATTSGDRFTTAAGSDVTGDGSAAAPFATVKQALAHASAGTTTILIDAGTYNERVIWNKNISLRGAGTLAADSTAATIFDGGLAPSAAQTSEVGIFMTASGGTATAPLTLSNLTIKAYDFGLQTDNGTNRAHILLEDVETVRNRQCGIYWNSLGGRSEAITFRRIRAARTALAPNTTANGAGRGLFLVNGSKVNILIEDGSYELNRRSGIDVNDGSVSGLVIRNCQFALNSGPAMSVLGAGGLRNGSVFTTPAALIEHNTVRNNGSQGLELKSCTGNGRPAGPGSFVVRNNYIVRTLGAPTRITSDNAGIAFVDRDRSATGIVGGINGDLVTGGAFIQGNTIRGYLANDTVSAFNINGYGIVLEGVNNKVFNNVVAQCQRGVQVQDRPTASTGVTPFFDISGNLGLLSSGDSIRNNRLDSCATAIRTINLTQPIDASFNWLGSNAASAVQGPDGKKGLVVTLQGPSANFAEVPKADAASRVDYSPFLDTRTDAASASGFQPDLAYLHVDCNSVQTGNENHLQEAASAIVEGGTLEAAAGTYVGTTTFSKSLTLTNTGTTTLGSITLDGPGKTVLLGAPFQLAGHLGLSNGVLYTTASTLLTLTDDATASAGNACSYVAGPLRKLGSQAFVFPLGKAGVWARLGISAPAEPATGFTAEYMGTPPATTTVTAPLQRISQVEHWTLTRTGSTSAVQVRLYWEDAFRSGINDFSPALQVARFDGTTWVTEGNGNLGGSLTAGSVASVGPVASFEAFTFGSASESNPLAKELLSFQVTQAQPRVINLTWVTQSENNPQGYAVERSFDSVIWQSIGFVEANSRSLVATTSHTYSYQDRPITTATQVYYRLRQAGLTSGNRYSGTQVVALQPVILATRTTAVDQLSLYPNPATDHFTLRLPMAAGSVHVTLLDVAGRPIYTQTTAVDAAHERQVQLPASLPVGTYLVQVQGASLSRCTIRFVKQ
ncbi:T9SS type A sorting domain-containing protein [Hymenobacter crusticola]|uniref:Uncharacterized protein n=1 Tax=Hymenobacter crusticola TaxID=1770526 RepID=A0A243WCG8_9BACT|nr:T9SS type A sorting domain-containing protein [Hymenobacter crusticola]OUJ73136.1 hypothetical protein BXP70_14995 [Hymenobacter crusticola]